MPFSILGSLSTDLSLPYSPAESFPFNSTAQTSAGTRGSRRQHRPAPRTAVLISILQDDISTAVPDFVTAGNNAAVPPVRVQQSAVRTAAREVYSAGAQSAKKASARWMKLLPAKRKLGRSSLEAAQSVRARAAEVDCGGNAHFLAMCSKLIYEDERIVRDVIKRRSGRHTPLYQSSRGIENSKSQISGPFRQSGTSALVAMHDEAPLIFRLFKVCSAPNSTCVLSGCLLSMVHIID